jgi:hypothetical protein
VACGVIVIIEDSVLIMPIRIKGHLLEGEVKMMIQRSILCCWVIALTIFHLPACVGTRNPEIGNSSRSQLTEQDLKKDTATPVSETLKLNINKCDLDAVGLPALSRSGETLVFISWDPTMDGEIYYVVFYNILHMKVVNSIEIAPCVFGDAEERSEIQIEKANSIIGLGQWVSLNRVAASEMPGEATRIVGKGGIYGATLDVLNEEIEICLPDRHCERISNSKIRWCQSDDVDADSPQCQVACEYTMLPNDLHASLDSSLLLMSAIQEPVADACWDMPRFSVIKRTEAGWTSIEVSNSAIQDIADSSRK